MCNSNNGRPMLNAIAAGLMALGVSASAFAQVPMEVSATVQNTLTAVVTTPLSFGTIFATTTQTNSSASGVRSPATAGAITLTGIDVGDDPLTFLSLGGSERGDVEVTVPPNNTTPFTVTLSGVTASTANQGGNDCGSALTNYLPLAHSSGDPTVPDFNVHSFTIAAGTGSTAVGGFGAGVTSTVTPAFAGSSASFFLGATIKTECVAGTYQESGTYAGTLTIDVGY